jgi:hypothetical protein
MLVGDGWSAAVLAGSASGITFPTVVLAGAGGVRIRATTKNTGANTSADTDPRRLSAMPLRTRRKEIIAGTIAPRHSNPPNATVAGKTASTAPRIAMMNVTVPGGYVGMGDGGWVEFIRTSFTS